MIGKTKLKVLEKLSIAPLHGYKLAKELNVSLSAIYAHLKYLEQKNLIEVYEAGTRKSYTITENGKKLLEILNTNISEKTDMCTEETGGEGTLS